MQEGSGEYFTDVPTVNLAKRETWQDLSINELIEIKNYLEEKLFFYRQNPAMSKPLIEAIGHAGSLIAFKSSISF
jgi:hypothetical protein